MLPEMCVRHPAFPLSAFRASYYVTAESGEVARPRYGRAVGAREKAGHSDCAAKLILEPLHLVEVEKVLELYAGSVIHRLCEGGNAILELPPDLPAVRLQSFQSFDLLFQGDYLTDKLLIRFGGVCHLASLR
jgi:hypothetical protein